MNTLEVTMPMSRRMAKTVRACNPISERDFMNSIDKAIMQADMGKYQEADEVINEISAELKI